MSGRRLNEEDVNKIKSMSEKRLTQVEIAEAIGCSVNTVYRFQRKFEIPASNRYGGGTLSQADKREIPILETEVPNIEIHRELPRPKRNNCGVVTAEKVVTFVGSNTGFMYGIGTDMTQIKITTNNKTDLVIDAKDLVSFGNELLDICDKLLDLQKLPW